MSDFCKTCCQDVDAASVAQERLTEIDSLRAKLGIAVKALNQCKIYSECYDELILTINEALEAIQVGQPEVKK